MNPTTFFVVYKEQINGDDFDYLIFYEGANENQAAKIKRANKGSEISVYPPYCYVPDKSPQTIMKAWEFKEKNAPAQ